MENRAKSFFFWLTEYKGRKLSNSVGEDAPFLLAYFMMLSIKKKEFIRAADNDFLTLFIRDIREYNWSNVNNKKTVRACFGENASEKVELLSNERVSLYHFLANNEDDFTVLRQTCGKTHSAKTIIRLVLNNEIFLQFEGAMESFGFLCGKTCFKAMSDNGKTATHDSFLNIRKGTLTLDRIEIDLTANTNDILSDFLAILCNARVQSACAHIETDEELEAIFSKGCPGFGPCSGGECEKILGLTLYDKILRRASKSGYTYSLRSDAARAVGLWLWDYIRESRCSVGAAAREIKKQHFLEPLGFSSSPDRVFERIYARTRDCIEEGEVLSIS